jgi:hypothetical protein
LLLNSFWRSFRTSTAATSIDCEVA